MRRDELEIRNFFDKASRNRDIKLQDPILRYEQDMRQRAVMELLAPALGELILDVGCGNARDIIPFAQKGATCVGVDFSNDIICMVRMSKPYLGLKNVDLILANATHLPFKRGYFDKISCSEVIEHIPDYPKAIAEINRVLKEGGKIVITTPNRHSAYGVVRKGMSITFGSGGRIFRALQIIRRQKSRGTGHPYDKWKTQKEVIGQ